jgi:SAM-dependent methyltransferase
MASPLPTILGWDLELLFVTEVFRLHSLHYGFWDTAPASVNLHSMREAQARFTERLMEFVPRDVKTVLDVGAGVGDNAQCLARLGLEVMAISPDRNHGRYFRRLHNGGIRYERTTFEDLDVAERFDLIFMCESLNYFDREIGLQQCRRYSTPSGYLLIAAMFRDPQQKPFPAVFSAADLPYVALARQAGFGLLMSRDVTNNVLATVEYAHRSLERYIFPLLRPFSPQSVLRAGLNKVGLSRLGRAIHDIRTFYDCRTDADYFRQQIRYMFLLFRREHRDTAITKLSV